MPFLSLSLFQYFALWHYFFSQVTSEWGSYLRSYKVEQDIFPGMACKSKTRFHVCFNLCIELNYACLGLGIASAMETFYVDNRLKAKQLWSDLWPRTPENITDSGLAIHPGKVHIFCCNQILFKAPSRYLWLLSLYSTIKIFKALDDSRKSFLSDPSPIIGFPCHSLTHSLTD